MLEEERLRKEIAELRAKIERSLSLTPSIYVTRTTKNGPIPQPGSDVLPDGRFRFNGSVH